MEAVETPEKDAETAQAGEPGRHGGLARMEWVWHSSAHLPAHLKGHLLPSPETRAVQTSLLIFKRSSNSEFLRTIFLRLKKKKRNPRWATQNVSTGHIWLEDHQLSASHLGYWVLRLWGSKWKIYFWLIYTAKGGAGAHRIWVSGN